jgi:hypothetical protein
MGPVARQVDNHQAIHSILCCAYITTVTVISIIKHNGGDVVYNALIVASEGKGSTRMRRVDRLTLDSKTLGNRKVIEDTSEFATVGITAAWPSYSAILLGDPTRCAYSVCLLGVSIRGVALPVSNKALGQ